MKNLNFSISKIILEGPEEDLKLTKNTASNFDNKLFNIQINNRRISNRFKKRFYFFAGHSLGEYSALVASGFFIIF